MRSVVCLLLGGVLFSGCAMFKRSSKADTSGKPPATDQKVIVTPESHRTGKVVRVNHAAKFAVLSFSIGSVPPLGQRMSVYRQGLKVGELIVDGPQTDENTVADITGGDVIAGDEVRSN